MPVHRKTLEALKKKGFKTDVEGVPVEQHAEVWLGIEFLEGLSSQGDSNWYRTLSIMQDQGEPLKEYVQSVKRVLVDGKEYVVCYYTIEGKSYKGIKATVHQRLHGVYQMPVWERTFDGRRNKWIEGDIIAGATEVYEFEFKGRQTKIERMTDQKMVLLSEMLAPDCKFHLIHGGIKLKIGPRGEGLYNVDDWFDMTREQIVAKYNSNPQQAALTELTRAITEAQKLASKI